MERRLDDISVRVWREGRGVFNQYSTKLWIPEEWRRSVWVPTFKRVMCRNVVDYRGMKLMIHAITLKEKVAKARLRREVIISKE